MKNINVIAMAGIGKRFLKYKYTSPKPVILINNKPMFFYATKSLPTSKKNIFISNIKLKKNATFKSYVKKYFQNSKILYVKKKTMGQAVTCNLATKFLNKSSNIVYSSCDYRYEFDKSLYKKLINKCDVIVFVNKPSKINVQNYKQYCWIKKGKLNSIEKIECKKKVSNKLMKDLVIVGSFAFKNKEIFTNSFKEMIKKKHRINNEYYMDILVKYSKKLKYDVKYLQVKNFKSFGTPQDIKKYVK